MRPCCPVKAVNLSLVARYATRTTPASCSTLPSHATAHHSHHSPSTPCHHAPSHHATLTTPPSHHFLTPPHITPPSHHPHTSPTHCPPRPPAAPQVFVELHGQNQSASNEALCLEILGMHVCVCACVHASGWMCECVGVSAVL